MTEEINIDYDTDILEKVDGFGKWQKFLFALLWIPSAFSAMPVFMYSFIAYTPEHWCSVPECLQEFHGDFVNFTAPSGEDSSCYRYK